MSTFRITTRRVIHLDVKLKELPPGMTVKEAKDFFAHALVVRFQMAISLGDVSKMSDDDMDGLLQALREYRAIAIREKTIQP